LEDAHDLTGPQDTGDVTVRPEFTSGGLAGHVLRLSLPSMLAMTFHSTYHIIDMMWLGRLGPERGTQAQAAVTAYMFFWMLLAIFNQLVALGSLTLIARSYGAKDYEETSVIIGQTFVFKLLFAVPAAALGYFFIHDAFLWYGVEKPVAVLGTEYGQIMLLAMPIYFSGFTLNTGFRSIGDVWKPMILGGITMSLNIALDPLFILGYGSWQGWGVKGAAYASLLSQSIFFGAGLYIFCSGRTFVRLRLRHLSRPTFTWIKKFMRIGAPAVIGDVCRNSSQFFIGSIVAGFGTASVAAFGIGGQFFMISWVPLFGVGTAVSTLVGQNLGAGKPDRAEKTTLWSTLFCLGIMAAVAAAAVAFAPRFVNIFNADGGVIVIGSNLMRVSAFTILFVSVSVALGAAFWGSGHTVPFAVISLVSLWGVQIPLVLLFVKRFETWVNHVWLSILIAEFAGCLMTIYLFSRGGWKRKKV
jgi:putative MATE family efflux protein